MLERTIFTIGHSNVKLDFFLNLLNKYKINCIVDVRSMPYSRYASQFNKEDISQFLKQHQIGYIHMGNEFGARRDDKSLYTAGYLDFEKTSKSSLFLSGVARVETGISRGFCIALMCMEKEAIDCHRGILIARHFYKNGYTVNHIEHNGSCCTQKDLEMRLVKNYFKDFEQLNLFSCKSYEEMINEAYRYRNAEIGYKTNDNEP